MLFFLYGARYGKNMQVYNKMYMHVGKNAALTVGDDFLMTSGDGFNPLCRMQRAMVNIEPGAVISIGNRCGMSSPCLWAKESITVGDNVKIGGDCILVDTDCHNLNFLVRRSDKKTADGQSFDAVTAESSPIVIEDDVMIGVRCIILKGVTIGARSVIGAGSVVTKSIPADCIAAGNPCRVIKTLIL